MGDSSSQPRMDPLRSPINAFSIEELYMPKFSESLQENTGYWEAPNTYEAAGEQTPWITKEEVALAKGWLAVYENNKDGNRKKKQGFWCEESEAEDEDYVQREMIHYEIETEIPFKLRHCWEILKDRPKWQEIALPKFSTGSEGSKRHKSSGSSSEESHRGSSSSSSLRNKPQVLVFAARGPNNNSYNKRNQINKNSNVVCINPNCGLPSHSVEKCYKIVGYSEHIKKKWANNNNQRNSNNFNSNNVIASSTEVPTSSASSANTQFTSEQMKQLINLHNSKQVKNIQTNMAGNLFCTNSKTFFKIYKTDKGWIIDSGANQHMVTSLDNLENIVDISDLNLQIDHLNGTTAFIKKAGNLKLSDTITLYDVLYIPKLTLEENSGGLVVNKEAWSSFRPSFKALKHKIDVRGEGTTAPCDICHHAKQTREPFPISEHSTTKVGEVVHLNV
nr:hypothetical protein [Tanacetum cinerariifolium]